MEVISDNLNIIMDLNLKKGV